MDVTQILMLITILVYLAAMVGIGAVLAKQNQTTDDFYLGGRTLGPLVTAMSAEASDMSSWHHKTLPYSTIEETGDDGAVTLNSAYFSQALRMASTASGLLSSMPIITRSMPSTFWMMRAPEMI